MSKSIRIGERWIGREHPPFVIAEMSGNHNQSIERALEIVESAAAAGAHALKIQTYTPDTMTIDMNEREFHISDPKSLWSGTSLFALYGQAQTPWEWHKPIFARARELGLIPFSSPFDHSAVDFLEELHVDCYKIASFENTDLPLIRRVARTGKPMIISTGLASVAEIEETVRVARETGCSDLILLKCTSSYPASPRDTNIVTIPHMRDLFDCEVGLSDHTMGVGVAVASVALGATVIEKHFTLRRSDGGVDSAFSLEPAELGRLVKESERAWASLGTVFYGPTTAELKSLQFRRSIYVVQDLKAGDRLTSENTRIIRPGLGLAPKHWETVMGMKVTKDVARGTGLSWDLLK
jgi:N-acetylneuraminate synthase